MQANGTFIRMCKTIKRGYWYRLLLAAMILSGHVSAEKQKRQIFREQVLPALGGKIPEEAFRTDRLALNRLNKEGITVPDGVILDARHVHKHPHSDQRMPEVIKVYLPSDGRYVSPEGRSYNPSKTADTTYVVRRPFAHTTSSHRTSNNLKNIKFHGHRKPPTYDLNYRFLPIAKPANVYKPVVTPLTLPADGDLLDLSTWDTDWDTLYEPFAESFVNNIAFFNSHQIITDYQGFLDEFYGRRSLKHVDSINCDRNQQYRQDRKYRQESKLSPTAYEKVRSHVANARNSNSAYFTSLTTIPKTSFSCRGRKGMFADVETKCQVFHNCSDWSKVSFLCPAGTAFCETKKRCEWFHTIQCK